MPTITFLPSGTTLIAKNGQLLLDAARMAGLRVDAPCGGKGTCGKCTARIIAGEVQTPPGLFVMKNAQNDTALTMKDVANDSTFITKDAVNDSTLAECEFILLCQSRLTDSDVTVYTICENEAEKGRFDDSGSTWEGVDRDLFPNAGDVEFIVKQVEIALPPANLGDGLSDFDRLKKALLKYISLEDHEAEIALSVLRTLPSIIRAADGVVMLRYYVKNGSVIITDAFSGKANFFGVAIDIGTTTVAICLVDSKGNVIGNKTGYNAQIECGLDIISRINYARNSERLSELRERVLETINAIIQLLCETNGIEPHDIINASIAANTTMTHLLLGVEPEYIRLSPYTPAIYNLPYYSALELGINVSPHSPVYIAPSVGSYLGGDIVSGLLCTIAAKYNNISVPYESESEPSELFLFIDIGTNGEIVIGNSDFLMGCACSAGPAFEGGGIKYGMRASIGAIEAVEIDSDSSMPICKVIGETQPKGICGSGMISLIAEMLKAGLLDQAGRFTEKASRVLVDKHYVLAKPDEYGNTKEIIVDEADIGNVIRAKAAIFSACRTMLTSLGMGFDDVGQVYIAGGFGRYLNISDAKRIGLIPGIDNDKFSFVGNSSVAGAYMTLVSARHRKIASETAARITYLDLSAMPGYMDEYTGALFLPHTDQSLFK